MVSKGAVAAGAAVVGAVAGAVATAFVTRPAGIPKDVLALLNTLNFEDTVQNQFLTSRTLMTSGKEGDWDIWNVGYGLPGHVPNDIIVDLGRNRVTGEVGATIGKLGYDSIKVYYGAAVVATLAQVPGTGVVVSSQISIKLA